jgi:hypothetical protein
MDVEKKSQGDSSPLCFQSISTPSNANVYIYYVSKQLHVFVTANSNHQVEDILICSACGVAESEFRKKIYKRQKTL